jgi:hypothetical protein
MYTIFTALIIPVRISEPLRVEQIDTALTSLQQLVGGDIESVTRGDWHVYLNAEGHLMNLPANIRAAQLIREAGLDLSDAARGTAVFLGRTERGGEADVPEHLLRRAAEMFGSPLAA